MSKGVFLLRSDAIYDDDPTRHYQFPKMYLDRAAQMAGDWIVYMEPVKAGRRGYHAVARVERIVPDPAVSGRFLALIEQGSYLELGRDVTFRHNGEVVEQGLLNIDGTVNRGRAVWAVRPLSDTDFNRILDLGSVDEAELLPRVGAFVAEEQAEYVMPGERSRVALLSNRIVRDRVFRKRILDVYDCTCALTGMKLINGGGRAEAEAAHIVPVEEGGPDVVTNGIALSGTVHWMFDRGLLSLSDDGQILFSSKINDIESVQKLVYPDRLARLPSAKDLRPHPRYLAWHRERHRLAA